MRAPTDAGPATVAAAPRAGAPSLDRALTAEGGAAACIEGRARLGRRTKRLAPRLGPGDIAVIDHPDLDRTSAQDLLASGVACVVNVSASCAATYPNPGPLLLVEGGVHLVDVPGADLLETLEDGERLTVVGGTVLRDGAPLAGGRVWSLAGLRRARGEAARGMADALRAFAANTMAHLAHEDRLLTGSLPLPELRTGFRGRHALVVVRGSNHREELDDLAAYVEERRPALVAVDGGADALIDAGLVPDVIVGDMDSASDLALHSGAELVVHAYPDGRAPGSARLDDLGCSYELLPLPGTSEDAALLLAAEKGAELVVSVGSHFDLVEFLGRSRGGASSSFITRLRVGDVLVDARAAARLLRAAG